MKKRRRRKCLNRHQLLRPDPRNRHHQRYCSQSDCRHASKAASQRRWLDKPENRDYFRGPEQVARVERWRGEHPGYWRKRTLKGSALQDGSSTQPIDKLKESGTLVPSVLQDLLSHPMTSRLCIRCAPRTASGHLRDQPLLGARRVRLTATDAEGLSRSGLSLCRRATHCSPPQKL